MSKSGRKLSRVEIFAIFICVLVLGYIGYMYFFDSMIDEKIANEKKAQEEIQKSLTDAYKQISEMRTQQAQLLKAEEAKLTEMPSYPASNQENSAIDQILQGTKNIDIKFNEPVRTDDQVRRSATVKFYAETYDLVTSVVEQISNCSYRCLIDEVRCSEAKAPSGWDIDEAAIVYSVEVKLTFYETMYGGRADEALKEGKQK